MSALVSAVTGATKVAFVAVSVALALTSLARTDCLVVAAAASASKYSSRVSVGVSGGPPGGAGGGAYPALPALWAAPNWSLPPAAIRDIFAWWSASL